MQYFIDKFFVGWVLMAATAEGVCWVEMGDSKKALLKNFQKHFGDQNFKEVSGTENKYFKKIINYLEGRSRWAKIPYDAQGTDFKKQVWQYLQTIPSGEVSTYGQVAEGVGRPKAYRAVASACATNPVPLVVPCHRVIPRSGGIGDFGPGPDKKQKLLDLEGF